VSVIGVNYLAWVGVTPFAAALWWTAYTAGAFAAVLVFIRLGLNVAYADPSLAVPQMVIALVSGVWAYAITGRVAARCFRRPS